MRLTGPLVALFAALLAHAALAYSDAPSPDVRGPWAGHETTEVTKGLDDRRPNKRKLYYILDKQCTGEISSEYLPCAAPQLLRVSVRHALRPPRVEVRDSLRAAYVWRDQPCRGAVAVIVEAAC